MAMVSVAAADSYEVLRRQVRGLAAGVRHAAAAEREQFPRHIFSVANSDFASRIFGAFTACSSAAQAGSH